jgi:autotransporter-associated beta strand protein
LQSGSYVFDASAASASASSGFQLQSTDTTVSGKLILSEDGTTLANGIQFTNASGQRHSLGSIAGANSSVTASGAISVSAAPGAAFFAQNATGKLILSGLVSGAGAGGIEINKSYTYTSADTVNSLQTPTGTVAFTRNNTYTGSTTISAGTLQIGDGGTGGGLSTSSAIVNNATLTFNRSNTITQGTDFNSVISGTGALIQAGSGNLVLSGVNTYTGNTTVSSGMIQISNASALGSTGNGTTVASGATLALSGNITLQGENITISGSGVGGNGALRNLAGSNTVNTTAVTITLAADAAIGSDEGTLTLERSSGNFITTSNNSNLTLVGAGNFTIRNNIALGSGGLTMNGTGSLNLGSASSSSYTGLTTINSGTFALANSDRINDSSSVVVNGGVFSLTTRNETVSGVTLAGGNITSTTGILTSLSDFNLQNGTVSAIMNGTVAVNKTTAGVIVFSGANTYTGSTIISAGTLQIGSGSTTGSLSTSSSIVNNATLSFNRSSTITQGTDLNSVISGTGSVIQAGAGTLVLSGANTYSGNTTISAGTLNLSNSLALQNSALDTSGAGVLTLSGVTAPTLGGLRGNKTLSSVITTDYGNLTGITLNPGTGISNSYSGVIADGAAGMALTKTGAGTQVLSGANTYTGSTTISAGTLQIGSGSTAGSLSTSSSIVNNGTLIFNRSNTITQGTDFNDAIGGTGSVIQAGSSTLVLSGANTYTGSTTISAGTLQIGGNGSTGSLSASSSIVNNGSLVFRRTTALVQGVDFSGSAITGTGAVIQNSSNSTTLNNSANSFSGTVWVQQGTLYTTGIGSSGANSALGSGGTISLGSSGNIGTLRFMGSANETTDKIINLAGTTGGATLTIDTTNTATYTFTSNFTATGNGNKPLSLQGSGNSAGGFILNGGISDPSTGATSLSVGGSGNVTATLGCATNSFSGPVSIAGNFSGKSYTLEVAGIGNAGNASYLGKNSTISIAAGTGGTNILRYTGSGEITDKVINLSSTATANQATLDASNASGLLKFTSDFTSTGAISKTLNLSGTGNAEIAGALVNNSPTNLTNITKTGTGTWTLSGNNTYGGSTTISAGTLSLSGNLSGTSGITINSASAAFAQGSTGLISGTGTTFTLTSGTATLAGSNAYTGATAQNGGTFNLSGNLSGTSGITINSASANFTQGSSSVISGAGTTFTLTSGTATLAGSNTYTGATTINGGTLVLNGTNAASAITVNSGGTLAGTGTGASTTINSGGKIGPGNSPGTLTVGNLTLNGDGIYTWEMANATGLAGIGWDQINATGLLTVGANATSPFTIAITSSGNPANWNFSTTNQTWDIIDYGTISGFNASFFTLNSTAFAGDLASDSSWALTDTGSALRLTYTYTATTPTYSGGTGVWSSGFTPAITNSANVTFVGNGGTATNNIASGTLSSIGILTFDGTNPYTLEANSGSAGFNSAAALAITGGITNNSSATQTINLATSYSTNQTINANTGNFVIGGNLSIGTGTTLTVLGSNSTTISGAVSGLGALTKSGTGTLTLAGTNTYSGSTSLAAGELVIGSATAIPGSTLNFSGTSTLSTSLSSVTLNNTVNFNASPTFGSNTNTGNFVLNGNYTLPAGSRTITVTNAATTVDLAGRISGNATASSLTKSGNGTLILSGSGHTYNGTTLTAGTLQLNNATNGGLGTGGPLTLNGGTLQALTTGRTVANAVNLGANITISGSQDLTLNGTMSVSTNGSKTLTNNIAAGKKLTLASVNINTVDSAARGLTIAGSGDTLIAGTIANGNAYANTLTITNTGTTTLSGSNTYTGATTISAGTLQIGDGGTAGSLSTSSNIANNGVLRFNRSDTITQGTDFYSVISGTGSLTQTGSGILVLSGANTYSGGTTLQSGSIVIGHANGAGAGAITQSSGSSLLRFDTTGTIANAMSLYNVSATQNVTLSGAITANNVTYDIASGVTTTISGNISGNGGTTKNGSGTVILSGNNSNTGVTTINSGTLRANSPNAAGSTSEVIVNNGGSFLVAATDAINDSANVTLAGGTLAVTGTINENVGLLTLSANSVIDLAAFTGTLRFSGVGSWSNNANLAIWNWNGINSYGTPVGDGANTRHVVFTDSTGLGSYLERISFYSGSGTGFSGSGFEEGFSGGGTEIIAVPEAEAWVTAALICIIGAFHRLRGKGKVKRLLLKARVLSGKGA